MTDKTSERSYSCCGGSKSAVTKNESSVNTVTNEKLVKEKIRQGVREQYANIVTKGRLDNPQEVEQVITPNYTADDMQNIPEGANLGLGSGNPVSMAVIQPGETVIDLGSGAGAHLHAPPSGEEPAV